MNWRMTMVTSNIFAGTWSHFSFFLTIHDVITGVGSSVFSWHQFARARAVQRSSRGLFLVTFVFSLLHRLCTLTDIPLNFASQCLSSMLIALA